LIGGNFIIRRLCVELRRKVAGNTSTTQLDAMSRRVVSLLKGLKLTSDW